jgi:hypothetical protein
MVLSTTSDPVPVTRIEILDAVEEVFDMPPVSAVDLVETARARGSRPQVLDTLRRVPGKQFRHPVELWTHLPDLPIDR